MLCIHAGSLKGNLWALCVEGLSLGSGFKESLPVLSVGPSPLSLSLRATCTKGGVPALGAPYSWGVAMLGRPWMGLMALGLEHQILVDGGAILPQSPSLHFPPAGCHGAGEVTSPEGQRHPRLHPGPAVTFLCTLLPCSADKQILPDRRQGGTCRTCFFPADQPLGDSAPLVTC